MKHLFASAFLFIAACGGSTPAASTEPAPKTGDVFGNPASNHCRNVGGELEIRDAADGQAGFCKKDGKECEEWALFRGQCPEIGPASPEAE